MFAEQKPYQRQSQSEQPHPMVEAQVILQHRQAQAHPVMLRLTIVFLLSCIEWGIKFTAEMSVLRNGRPVGIYPAGTPWL